MLVLSRRESDKILFPTLGITVEVVRISGNAVRLGVDAPKEIRVLRGELEGVPKRSTSANPGNQKSQPTSKSVAKTVTYRNSDHPPYSEFQNSVVEKSFANQTSNSRSDNGIPDIKKCLDAANLAIFLAQNQLRQQLNDRAEEALENAIQCLEQLELAIIHCPSDTQAIVNESRSAYRTAIADPTVVLVESSSSIQQQISQRLDQLGYRVIVFTDATSLVEYLKQHDQPDVVLTRTHEDSFDTNVNELVPKNDGLRIFGVSALKKIDQRISIGNAQIQAWCADASDAHRLTAAF